jgi:hypothetical protein
MTTPSEEASAILIRMFDTLAASMGKRLKETHKIEIRRACELLSADGTLEPLEDVARVSPAEAMVEAVQTDPGYKRWREERSRDR